jgi:hypothetical protein
VRLISRRLSRGQTERPSLHPPTTWLLPWFLALWSSTFGSSSRLAPSRNQGTFSVAAEARQSRRVVVRASLHVVRYERGSSKLCRNMLRPKLQSSRARSSNSDATAASILAQSPHIEQDSSLQRRMSIPCTAPIEISILACMCLIKLDASMAVHRALHRGYRSHMLLVSGTVTSTATLGEDIGSPQSVVHAHRIRLRPHPKPALEGRCVQLSTDGSGPVAISIGARSEPM